MAISVAIDGPAGAGKSTIAKRLAAELGFVYVDTGAMYRAMALYFLRSGIAGSDEAAVERACSAVDIRLDYQDGVQQIYLNGENVSNLIRTPEVSDMASQTSAYHAVRAKLVELQRKLAASANVIMDGRDIGTAVLPDADVKIFLTASSRVRAERRWRDLQRQGSDLTVDEVEADIIARDHRDMTRSLSPLVQAEDAVLLDSSDMTPEEVIDRIKTMIRDLDGRVILAGTAGFCFGVRRAMDMAEREILKGKGPLYTFGPIIHNEEVVRSLENRGVTVLESEEELERLTEGTVILRSHGVTRHIYDLLRDKGIEFVDVTCPFVKKIHEIVQQENRAGRRVIIAGDPTHPEVEGICGWADERTKVIGSAEEFASLNLPKEEKITLVAQTTFNFEKFEELVEKINQMNYSVNVINTICNATQERQAEARRIAARVDAMIVIGGLRSSNTRKLYDICRQECSHTYYIQTLKELQPDRTLTVRNVGITAGASTPDNIIEEVHNNVRRKFWPDA